MAGGRENQKRYLPFLRETLQQHPRLRATRLYRMIRDRGYAGSVEQFENVFAAGVESQIEKRAAIETGRRLEQLARIDRASFAGGRDDDRVVSSSLKNLNEPFAGKAERQPIVERPPAGR